MNKLLSYKACRDFLDHGCNDKIREGKTLNFSDPLTSCQNRRTGYGSSHMGKGRGLYKLIGGASVAASVIAAFMALRERNIYYMRLAIEGDSHVAYKNEGPILNVRELAENFMSGNRMHFLHSVAIMAAPYGSSVAFLTTCLFLSGITLYSGTQYYRTCERKPKEMSGVLWAGGFLLFTGWLTFLI